MTTEQNLIKREDDANSELVNEQETRKDTKKKRSHKSATGVVTDEVLKKVSDALREMSEEIKQRTIEQKPAEVLIRANLKEIDAMTKNGTTINQIYERINKVFKLNISAASFGVYVRKIRKECGSELSAKRTKKSVIDEQITNSFKCEHCKSESLRYESRKAPGNFFWKCAKCGTFYKDRNGELTNETLKASTN